jgi:hypothetical protein
MGHGPRPAPPPRHGHPYPRAGRGVARGLRRAAGARSHGRGAGPRRPRRGLRAGARGAEFPGGGLVALAQSPSTGSRPHMAADGLDATLRKAEIVVLLLPDTPATENTLNARTLALLPRGAVIVNPGRGPLIDDAGTPRRARQRAGRPCHARRFPDRAAAAGAPLLGPSQGHGHAPYRLGNPRTLRREGHRREHPARRSGGAFPPPCRPRRGILIPFIFP